MFGALNFGDSFTLVVQRDGKRQLIRIRAELGGRPVVQAQSGWRSWLDSGDVELGCWIGAGDWPGRTAIHQVHAMRMN